MSEQGNSNRVADEPGRRNRTLEDIWAQAQRACGMLLSPTPEAVKQCAAEIGLAAENLAEWRKTYRARGLADPELALDNARRLRAAARRARRLLDSAAAFHAGWREMLGSLCSGYTSSGAPAGATLPGRLCLRG
jgi:transposase-like protein